jgi:hypothetical protein
MPLLNGTQYQGMLPSATMGLVLAVFVEAEATFGTNQAISDPPTTRSTFTRKITRHHYSYKYQQYIPYFS